METKRQETSKGFMWSAIERFSVQGIQFIFQIILARLLSPSDYGVIAMLAIFMAIGQSLIDSGFTNALIKKTNRTDVDFSTVFYFNIVTSIVIYIVFYFSAPAIANFYKTPELVDITRVYTLSLPIMALAAVQRTQYTIQVNFKDQAIASFVGALVGGIVGVIFASRGYGAWALVYSAIATNLTTTVIFWVRSPWRPSAQFSMASLKSMFAFGSKLMLSGLLDTIYKNLYQFVIGRKFSKQDLGYYSRADQFAQFPSSNITGIMQRVTYPVLCSMADDENQLLDSYRRYIKLASYIVFPLMLGLAAVAKPLINLVLGSKWSDTALLLQVLCFSYMLYPIHAINLNYLMVKGRSDLFFRVEVIKKAVGLCILLIVMNFNVKVMAFGNIISSIIALFINTYYTRKMAGYGIGKQLKDILPSLILSVVACAPAAILSELFPHNGYLLIVSIASAVLIYIFLSKLIKLDEFVEISSSLRNIVHNGKK